MNTININIYTSLSFTNLTLDLNNEYIIFNNKKINLNSTELISITNYLLNIIESWNNIELIKATDYIKIEVKTNLEQNIKSYSFNQKIPHNFNKIYDLINKLKEK